MNDYFQSEPAFSDWLAKLVEETARMSRLVEDEKKRLLPPLNMVTTTPKNFTRFVYRVGPLFDGIGK